MNSELIKELKGQIKELKEYKETHSNRVVNQKIENAKLRDEVASLKDEINKLKKV